MQKTKLTIFFAVIFLALFGVAGVASAATLEVGVGKTYVTIQSAVSAAQTGDTIYIYNGIYKEPIITTKTGLTIVGESRAGVVWTSMKDAVGTPSWIKTGGYINIYQTNATDVVSGTLRGVVDEYRTGIYAAKTSLADVDAIPGTFYVSGGVLYVHTSDHASPSTHILWYTNLSDGDILKVGGNSNISNITFIGATQAGVFINGTLATIGDNILNNIEVLATMMGVYAISSNGSVGNTAGTLSIINSSFNYNLKPTYDPAYSVFTNAQGVGHSYLGNSVSSKYLNTINIDGSIISFSRSATEDDGSLSYNIRRCKVTDIVVHPHMHNMASYNVLRIENSIFSRYGSTSGPRSDSAITQAGFKIYLINNTVYAGENPALGGGDKRWFSAADSSSTKLPSEVFVYNNLFIRDQDSPSNNAIPLTLESAPLSAIHMDNNYYTRGRVSGSSPNENYIDHQGINYTASAWKTYTAGQGYAQDANSIYEATPSDTGIAVTDYRDIANSNFGKILENSPLINKASSYYSPATDFAGTLRPQGAGFDIGAFEYVSSVTDTTPPSAPSGLAVN